MIFDGLGLGYLDQVALAAHDLIHADTWIREHFGGSELPGTASITPTTTALVGVGTSWASTIGEGDRLLLGSQVATVESVASNTSLEIAVAHAVGLDAQTIHKAARGYRVDRSDGILTDVSMPYWTVGAGTLPSLEPGIGRLLVNPSLQVTLPYEGSPHPLGDRDASWSGLVHLLLSIFGGQGSLARLCVDRFGQAPLVYRLESAAPGDAILRAGDDFLLAPAVSLTWQGMDPLDRAANVVQRW